MFSERTNTGINGTITIPGDKSISHRSIIIPSISSGVCEISNILKSDDVLKTINAFEEMGVKIKASDVLSEEDYNRYKRLYGVG